MKDCKKCGKKFKQIAKHEFKPTCDCYPKGMILMEMSVNSDKKRDNMNIEEEIEDLLDNCYGVFDRKDIAKKLSVFFKDKILRILRLTDKRG